MQICQHAAYFEFNPSTHTNAHSHTIWGPRTARAKTEHCNKKKLDSTRIGHQTHHQARTYRLWPANWGMCSHSSACHSGSTAPPATQHQESPPLVNMVLNVHRNHKAYWGWGEGGEGSMEVGGKRQYIPIATLSPPEWLLHYGGQWWEPF